MNKAGTIVTIFRYCLVTNSRPIQQAEQIFFSVKHEGSIYRSHQVVHLLMDPFAGKYRSLPSSQNLTCLCKITSRS